MRYILSLVILLITLSIFAEEYKLQENGAVRRKSDGAWIPNEPKNMDWVEYQEWVSKGGMPEPMITAEEQVVLDAQAKEQERQLLIDSKKEELAVKELIKEGKLDADGNIPK